MIWYFSLCAVWLFSSDFFCLSILSAILSSNSGCCFKLDSSFGIDSNSASASGFDCSSSIGSGPIFAL